MMAPILLCTCTPMYTPLRPSQHFTLPIRSYTYHVRHWGTPHSSAPPLVLLHGWMDVGASYQFVVDAFSADFYRGRHIIAPDWRGFGHSLPPAPCDHYSFADYLGDLDTLLGHPELGLAAQQIGRAHV